MANYISFTNVSYSYQSRPALSNINIDIARGDSIALIGPNGSGKSTLLKVLNGIIFPESGKLNFDGDDISSYSMKDSRFSKLFHSRIGFLMQNSDSQLFCTNVYEEIAFAPRQMGIPESETEKRVEDCMEMLNIGALRHTEPYHLSEGEKKKVALASILSMNPEVLALDEPMNGLDPRTKHFLKNLIISLNKSGKTIICSTHDFEYVKGIFSHAAVFSSEHTIEKTGDYEDIINDKEFLIKMNII